MRRLLLILVLAVAVLASAPVLSKVPLDKNYSGNVESFKFHVRGCKHFECRKCTRYFDSYGDAIAAGFKACNWCRPSAQNAVFFQNKGRK